MTDPNDRVLIIGCGRWLRLDDQVGLVVAESLRRSAPPGCRVLLTEAPAADIPGRLNGVELVVLVDAARSNDRHPPGSTERLDFAEHRAHLRSRADTDTHCLSVDLGLSLASEMGWLPSTVWIYAIAADDCGHGEELTPRVAAAAKEAARRIMDDIAAWMTRQEVSHA